MIASSGTDNVTVDLTERTPKSDVGDPLAACGLVDKRGETLTILVNVDPGVVQTNRTVDAGMNEDVGEVLEALRASVSVEWRGNPVIA